LVPDIFDVVCFVGLVALVEKARSYNRSFRIWGGPNPNAFGHCGTNTRGTTIDKSGEAQINLYEARDHCPQGRTWGKKVLKEEKDHHFKAGLCFYCRKSGHCFWDCVLKRDSQQGKPSGGGQNTRTRQVTTEELEPQEEAAPTDYKSHREAQVAQFYPSVECYDIVRPKSAPINEDF
jgi:hypothetical protein